MCIQVSRALSRRYFKYKDLNEDGKITAGDDRRVIGKNFPSWTGGLNVGLYYKDFDFSMLWQGAFDVDAYYTGEASYFFFNSGKVLKRHLDRWTPENHKIVGSGAAGAARVPGRVGPNLFRLGPLSTERGRTTVKGS